MSISIEDIIILKPYSYLISVCYALVIIGAINWGTESFGKGLVQMALGKKFSKPIYGIVGVAGALLVVHFVLLNIHDKEEGKKEGKNYYAPAGALKGIPYYQGQKEMPAYQAPEEIETMSQFHGHVEDCEDGL
ncbi:MAG: hypothetical protein CMA10_04705 [Euryarchaeota archaeon]|nr:hypothetical protein [Euryarchaeota archaeon]|tara:strand:+ start:10942 stop:11340 length:399 start_codon:yes stop_codon:yes gene_type:complete